MISGQLLPAVTVQPLRVHAKLTAVETRQYRGLIKPFRRGVFRLNQVSSPVLSVNGPVPTGINSPPVPFRCWRSIQLASIYAQVPLVQLNGQPLRRYSSITVD